ncbi:MAG: arginine--tRNA ligase [Rhodovulum sulfidophilum]|uniref:Arginine--tRNA ligase n=1 Tax=Rhodovulum sulfidophilum TaxID=35806 RepID=A0A2W5NFB1_RHOSU|nr:MAG: arginine--tRNA ligase [Rhodovulum sulfidophilum]
MDLFAEVKALVVAAVGRLVARGDLPEGLDLGPVTVEPPRDPAHGDMATNVAMVLARPARKGPREIAEALAPLLAEADGIGSVEVAGPGFLNLRLAPGRWFAQVPAILARGRDVGRSTLGAGRKVNVEFVSANPTGPLHIGHTRGAVFGDALAALLDFAGYKVTREYYINDGGAQVDVLARSVYLRYLEALGREVEFPEGSYPGEYLVPVGAALAAKYGDAFAGTDHEEWLPTVRDFAIGEMMGLIREDLELLNVRMDTFFSERSLYGTGQIEAALGSLEAKGLIYEGVLEPPKGKAPEDWEPRVQTLFKSTDYGDDVDRPVKKSDGSWTYFAPDIAYHYTKVERGFDELIDVLGADHGGYVKRMRAAVAALSDNRVPLDIKLCQLVKLTKDGQPFKMSKRAGTFVTLRDLIELVGPDVTRFVMLTRKNDAPLDFDLDKVLEQSKENPVFYVQYAHARACSVLNRAAGAGFSVADADLALADLAPLGTPGEMTLSRKLGEWPRQVEVAASNHEPHRIAFYLYELASDFHALQHQGKLDPEQRFLREDAPQTSRARLALVRATAVVISAGLGILGVTPMDEMR